MKRKYLFLVLLSTLVFGCGNSNNSESYSSLDTSLSEEVSSENVSSSQEESISISSKEDTTSKILEDLNKGLSNFSKVKKGTMIYNDSSKKSTWNYEYGEDKYGTFVKVNEKPSSTPTDFYYGYDASNNVYSFKDTYGKVQGTGEEIHGSEVYGPSVNIYGTKLSGGHGTMMEIYTLASENKNNDFFDLSSGNTKKFMVSKFIDDLNPSLWEYTVSYQMSDDIFSKIDITLKQYKDIIADYEYGTYYPEDNATPVSTHTISITQTSGERTLTNPHDIETYYFSSFDFVDSSKNVVGEELFMDAKIDVILSLDNIAPSTANSSVDPIRFYEETGLVKGTYSSSTKKLTIKCEEEGIYDIKLSTKKVNKSFKLNVSKAAPTEVTIFYYIPSGDGHVSEIVSSEKTSFNMYNNATYYLKPNFSPTTADQEHTFEMISGDTTGISFELDEIKISDWLENFTTVYRIEAYKEGEYRFKATSKKDTTVYIEFSINVISVPLYEDLIENRYVRNSDADILVDVNFTPTSEDKKQGIVSVSDDFDSNDYNGNYKYSYKADTKSFDLVKLDGSGNELSDTVGISLEFNERYDLVYFNGVSSTELNIFSHELMISNIEWLCRDSGGGWVTLTFSRDGKGSFHYSKSDENFRPIANFACSINYEVVESNGRLIITLDETSIENILAADMISNVGELSMNTDYSNFVAEITIYDVVEKLEFHIGG